MELIRAYKTETVIQGLTKTVLVSIEVENETDIDLSYMDTDHRDETERRLERGQLSCVWVKVTARFSELSHFEGIDTLGQVFCKDRADIESCVSDHDMSQNAIADLVAQTLQGIDSINQFLKAA